MTILFDLLCAQPAPNGTKFHGGGEYAKAVFAEVVCQATNQKVIAFYNYDCFMDDWIIDLIKRKSIATIDIKKYAELKDVFCDYKVDVYYSALPYLRNLSFVPPAVYRIGTVHGLRLLEKNSDDYEYYYASGIIDGLKKMIKPLFGGALRKKWWNRYFRYLKDIDYVVCVSNHTKYAIRNYFPALEKDIHVYYTPCKHYDNSDSIRPEVEDKYILIIGGNRWEKNTVRTIESLEGIRKKGLLDDYKIVIVGNIPNVLKKKITDKSSYVFYGYVSSDKLENLYKYCDLFLYLSLNEGFGMPPLEAMKYGKTCVVSGVCSLPEICGDAVYYVNPYDISEIQNRIIMALENKKPENIVLQHEKSMRERQKQDLDSLSKYILNCS